MFTKKGGILFEFFFKTAKNTTIQTETVMPHPEQNA